MSLPSRTPRWRRTAGAVGVTAGLLLLAGCGEEDVDPDAPVIEVEDTEAPDLDVDDPGDVEDPAGVDDPE